MEARKLSTTTGTGLDAWPEDLLQNISRNGISHDDFSRVYKGSMVEIVDVVANNIVGRRAANSARATIQQDRETVGSQRRHVAQETDPLYASANRAESHLKAARLSLDDVRRTGSGYLEAVYEQESEERKLQDALEGKRRVILLLSILERKERIRSERLVEIANLLERLRQKASDECHKDSGGTIVPSIASREIRGEPIRAEYTRDTIATLQSHRLRISRLSAQAEDRALATKKESAEQRLVRAMSQSVGFVLEGNDPLPKVDSLKAAIRSRSERQLQYRSPLPQDSSSMVEHFEDLSLRVRDKENELQQLVYRSAALITGCAQSLQTITDFAEDTSLTLETSLQEESKRAQGHVDILRLSILHHTDTSPGSSRENNIGHGKSFPGTLNDIQQAVVQAQQNVSFVTEVHSLATSDPVRRDEYASLTSSYTQAEGQVSTQQDKLMMRKAKKAGAGEVLVKEIERLAAEAEIISGTHI